MRIAVIGAGGAGMTTAYYLAAKHDVVVFEKQAIAGGSVRTINRNVNNANVPGDIYLDNGVIEFHLAHSPNLLALMAELDVPLETFEGGSSSLYRENEKALHMPGVIRRCPGWLKRVQHRIRLMWIMRTVLLFIIRLKKIGEDGVLGDVLGQDPMSNWLRMLIMYGYSMPFETIDDFPASLAAQTLRQGNFGTRWMRVPGGVYSYMEKILEKRGSRIEMRTGQTDIEVSRLESGVTIHAAGQSDQFDRIVVATQPDQVLSILKQPSESERQLFSAWKANVISTAIHTDTSIYDKWEVPGFMEFDVFEKSNGSGAGYNAYLNRLSGLPEDGPLHYFLSFNLVDWIDPSKIVDRQVHHTPLYTRESFATQAGIRALSGTNSTYFAGAYLENGLHEGAITSGLNVSKLLK